jgi:hypothetical protein
MDLNTNLKRNNERFLFSNLGNEGVLMDLTTGNYIGLNSIGNEIWHLLENETTPLEIISKLREKYNISQNECKQDVLEYLETMKSKSLFN